MLLVESAGIDVEQLAFPRQNYECSVDGMQAVDNPEIL